MEPRIFHGNLNPAEIARSLVAEFNRGNLRAQQFGNPQHLVVQISSQDRPQSGGQTALTVTIQKVADGVSIQVGQQNWLGVAASLGQTALMAWLNPWNLISRLDDLAQDIENLKMVDRIWLVIESTVRAADASFELSDRLRRLVCGYCETPNEIGIANCVACGAPLGSVQPRTCMRCGFVIKKNETHCPNCQARL